MSMLPSEAHEDPVTVPVAHSVPVSYRILILCIYPMSGTELSTAWRSSSFKKYFALAITHWFVTMVFWGRTNFNITPIQKMHEQSVFHNQI